MPKSREYAKPKGRTEQSKKLPTVRKPDVVAVLCSDIHLCHTPPVFRSEEDWYAAMKRPLDQLRDLVSKHNNPPLVCAGDIFDHWRLPPELINFALINLPKMYAIPGQHDLPYHRYDEVKKSCYWTLVETGLIIDVKPGIPLPVAAVVLHAFPWGFGVEPLTTKEKHDLALHIAVLHKYIWIKDYSYPDAPPESRVKNLRESFEGYDVVLVGDNHKGFQTGNVYNSGGFMVRKSDEREYKPSVGLLYSDGTLDRVFLDKSEDKYLTDIQLVEELESGISLSKFIKQLNSLGDSALDFKEAIISAMRSEELDKETRKIILTSLEGKK